MRINGIRCDVCNKEHLFAQTFMSVNLGIAREMLPPGWLILIEPETENANPILFCGRYCLREWVLKQITANDIPLEV